MDRIVSVISPAASYDLIDLATVKGELGISDTASDATIAQIITAASRAVADYCCTVFAQETLAEQFRAYPFIDSSSLTNSPEYIWLRRVPITSISTVTLDGEILMNGTDFEADMVRGRLTRLFNDLPIRWFFRKLSITYEAGYVIPDSLPPQIARAATEIVKGYWLGRDRDPFLRSEQLVGIGSLEYYQSAPALLSDIASGLLGPYQRPMF